MAFRVESSIQSSFNKTQGKGTTRLGNWEEEEALREVTGYHRQASAKEKAFHLTQDRVITHRDKLDSKDYKSTAHSLHARPETHAEYKPVNPMGPRAQRKLEEMKRQIQGEADAKEARYQAAKRRGDYGTVQKASFVQYDPELTRHANPRVAAGRTGALAGGGGGAGQTLGGQRTADRAALLQYGAGGQAAVTLYSSALRGGAAVTGATAAPGHNPFGRSSAFTNELAEGHKQHAEGNDRGGGLRPAGLGPTAPQRAAADRVKALLRARASAGGEGNPAYRALARAFRRLDASGNQKLSPAELALGLADLGLVLKEEELVSVVAAFDRDQDGQVSVGEFMRFLRRPMGARRAELVNLAYDRLDANGDGKVTVADLEARFDAGRHPDVLKGRKDAGAVLREFLGQWDQGERDGLVSREEFTEYYADISCTIDDDDYWELMIRNAWHLSGGEGLAANTTCRRVLVVFEDGSQSVEEIEDDLGLRADDVEGMRRRLQAQGLTGIERVELCH